MQNGEEVRREQIGAGAMTAAVPRVVRVGTNDDVPVRAAPSTTASVWDASPSARPAATGRTNTGNGYYGGLQFDAGTWGAYGGGTYAALPTRPGARSRSRSRRRCATPGRRLRRLARLLPQARAAPVMAAAAAGCTLSA